MKRAININRNLLVFGVPFSLILGLIFLMKSSFVQANDTISLAITVDLLLIVPLVYFLLIRKTGIPKTTVFPVMIIGLVIGSYFMPEDGQSYLSLFKVWALPVIEISVFTYVIFKVRKAVKKYKSLKGRSLDFFSILKSTCRDIVPKKAAILLATEIAVFYYCFISWKRISIKENEFTYHKNSGTQTLLLAFILIIGVETTGLHHWLADKSLIAAWVLTGLSIYTAFQVLGFTKSISKRPITINSNSLTLKYGILNEVEIPFSDIESIELSTKDLEKNELTRLLSPLGSMESHNVVLKLSVENEMVGLYGIKKKFKIIGFHIDEPKAFSDKLKGTLHQGR